MLLLRGDEREAIKAQGFTAGVLGVLECHCPYANVGGRDRASRKVRDLRRVWIEGQKQGHQEFIALQLAAGLLGPDSVGGRPR